MLIGSNDAKPIPRLQKSPDIFNSCPAMNVLDHHVSQDVNGDGMIDCENFVSALPDDLIGVHRSAVHIEQGGTMLGGSRLVEPMGLSATAARDKGMPARVAVPVVEHVSPQPGAPVFDLGGDQHMLKVAFRLSVQSAVHPGQRP